ncbi:MAG: hypothetical protein KBE65_12795 [Phycisphaerae bacterium]|nr:hypothetical protein [Phycisphaerae bacterium]
MSAEQRDFDKEAAAGFEEVGDTTVAEVTKPARDGQLRRFTVFLMTGFKKGRG